MAGLARVTIDTARKEELDQRRTSAARSATASSSWIDRIEMTWDEFRSSLFDYYQGCFGESADVVMVNADDGSVGMDRDGIEPVGHSTSCVMTDNSD